MIGWVDGGTTDLENLTLVCGFHHREHAKLGWAVRITDGLPDWIPPRWLDPQQTSRRNTTHHIPLHFGLHRISAVAAARDAVRGVA